MWIQTAASERMALAEFMQQAHSDSFYSAVQQTILEWQSQDYISFQSSGSTGAPKLLSFHKKLIAQSAKATIEYLAIRASSPVFLVTLHPRYTGGRMMVLRALIQNANMLLVPPTAKWLDLLPSNMPQIDLCALTPLQIHALLDAPLPIQLKFKNLLVGGAGLNASTIAKLKLAPFRAFETFGMTETISHFALKQIGVDAHFVPLPGYLIRLDSRQCIEVSGPTTNGEWLTTNDMATLYADNTFDWLGRIDFVVNSGGVKLHPEALENSIKDILNAEKLDLIFALTSMPDEHFGEKLVMVYEQDTAIADMQALLTMLKKQLPAYAAPKKLIPILKLPLTPSGKTDRKSLKQMLMQ
jgi:O-succinylbenzoic acid--CoA ligase